ncbi:MAG: 30S ribosomal protein S3 [Candidatus Odinarchaeum yellowstonii]|uniref:Small ribosomal subunit protein uS3 n=1 Tax=Odinarchaeota yellowstonii (strain LCB_4) TaxID=1841599 RepID=A0AAF0D1D3_ODILC|nr:MAG: 30S ribosomal protein S3 [Candidatus Odinarchaeum yellowstonii]
MPAKTHFVQTGIKHTEIDAFLAKELSKAGYSGVDVQKTPLGARVIIYAERPGMVIGRSGKNIRDLTTILEEKFGLENPQIEVSELEIPELKARVVANLLVQRLERGDHFRRAAYAIMRRVMAAGSKGVEIKISGKLSSERAKYQKFHDGVICKAGEPAMIYVDHAALQAYLKPGVIGVQVKIMPPDVEMPDVVKIKPRAEPAPVKEEVKQPATVEESARTETIAAEESKTSVKADTTPESPTQEVKAEPEIEDLKEE